jgi:hypothetical protein
MALTPLLEAAVLTVLGLLSLLLGKRLFWLFAGIVGFALGWWLTGLLLPSTTDPILFVVIGVIVGLILAGLSHFLGKWAIRIVAAIAGFVILPLLLSNLNMMGGLSEYIWAVIGAVLGFVLALFLADWTLIFLSSILGAGLILNGARVFVTFSEAVSVIVGFVLIAVGVILQSRQKS